MFHRVQHLQRSINFGQLRKLLREFIGIAPSYPVHEWTHERKTPEMPALERWAKRWAIWRRLPAWTYLMDIRRLPFVVVSAAIRREQVKEGPHASAWFAHRDHEGRLTGIEIRSSTTAGSPRVTMSPCSSSSVALTSDERVSAF